MSYQNCYAYYHDIATRYAKQGTKNLRGVCGLKCRLDPRDSTKVQLGVKLWWGWHEELPDGKRKWITIPPKDRPFLTYLTLEPGGIRIPEFSEHDPTEFAALQTKYPKTDNYKTNQTRVRRAADATLNNLLAVLHRYGAPAIRHDGCRDQAFLGFDWQLSGKTTPLVGPIFFDAAQHKLVPLEAQPQRIEDKEARKLVNTRLRAAYKRLRMLHAMSVHPAVSDVCIAVGADGNPRKAEDLVAWLTPWKDPQALLEQLETTDFTDSTQVHQLCFRMAAIRLTWWLGGPSTVDVVMRVWNHSGTTDITENYLAATRRALQRALGIVKYV